MELHVVPTARYDEPLLCWGSFTYVACMLYPCSRPSEGYRSHFVLHLEDPVAAGVGTYYRLCLLQHTKRIRIWHSPALELTQCIVSFDSCQGYAGWAS